MSTASHPTPHCAFCHSPILQDLYPCPGCNRRVYCCKGCLEADFQDRQNQVSTSPKAKGMGQGHENWCGIDYGEEGIDWTIGQDGFLTALREFPQFSRILVEGPQTLSQDGLEDHPGFHAIKGINAKKGTRHLGKTLKERKFNGNCIKFVPYDSPEVELKWILGLRVARARPVYLPNAVCMLEPSCRVLILYARRHISAGETITCAFEPMSYGAKMPPMISVVDKLAKWVPAGPKKDKLVRLPSRRETRLKWQWRQLQPPCRCETYQNRLRQFFSNLERMEDAVSGLEAEGKAALENLFGVESDCKTRPPLPADAVAFVHYLVFTMYARLPAMPDKELGLPHLKEALAFYEKVLHPRSWWVQKMQNWLAKPETLQEDHPDAPQKCDIFLL